MQTLFKISMCTVLFSVTYANGYSGIISFDGHTDKNGFKLHIRCSEQFVHAEFLTNKATLCSLTTESQKCGMYNYNLSANQIEISSKKGPQMDKEYGVELIFKQNNDFILVYSSGLFSSECEEFMKNDIKTTPIRYEGNYETSTDNKEFTTPAGDIYFGILLIGELIIFYAVYSQHKKESMTTSEFREDEKEDQIKTKSTNLVEKSKDEIKTRNRKRSTKEKRDDCKNTGYDLRRIPASSK